jgi:hypothetical protein
MRRMSTIAVVLLVGGFIGACLAEPWSKIVRDVSGSNSPFYDPSVVRMLGYAQLAAGVLLFAVHLYRD